VTDFLDRARGALLGTFVGDALGMPYEGVPPSAVPERLEMRDARLGRGTYTDDTQMTIALAESLLERGGADPDALGHAFLAAYDPRRGYGGGTRAVLRLIESGTRASEAAVQVFGGEGSLGNGAAMRVAPVAVRFADEPERVAEQADRSARATHGHIFGIDAARVQAAAVAAGLRGEDVPAAAHHAAATAELRHRIDAVTALLALDEDRARGPAGGVGPPPPAREPGPGSKPLALPGTRGRPPTPEQVASVLGTTSAGLESVPTAIYAACAHDEFEQAVTFAVRCGGDTDTIGAMSGAIAGAMHGAGAIPPRWLKALEDGARGRTYVASLAERLVAAR
jgi:poly(ADP-ribose) glycohydrolase ARH3